MNCTDCQRVILENGGRDHDAALIAHLAECSACSKVNERTLTISKLLALKRFEQPNPHFEIRNAAAIRKRLSEEKPSIFEWNPASLFRPIHALLGVACLCIAAAGVYYSAGPSKENVNNVVVHPVVEAVTPAQPEVVNPALAKPLLVIQDVPPPKGAVATHTQFGAETNLIKPADFQIPQR